VVRFIFQPFEKSAFTNFAKEAPDFSFAFNDSNFSDRVLQIQVLLDSQGDGFDDDMLDSINGLQTSYADCKQPCWFFYDDGSLEYWCKSRESTCYLNNIGTKECILLRTFLQWHEGIEETEYHSSDKFFGGNDIHGFIAVYVQHNTSCTELLEVLMVTSCVD
jgi:hypothetical protein